MIQRVLPCGGDTRLEPREHAVDQGPLRSDRRQDRDVDILRETGLTPALNGHRANQTGAKSQLAERAEDLGGGLNQWRVVHGRGRGPRARANTSCCKSSPSPASPVIALACSVGRRPPDTD